MQTLATCFYCNLSSKTMVQSIKIVLLLQSIGFSACKQPLPIECSQLEKAYQGDNCQFLENEWSLTHSQLLSLNPSLQSDCSNFKIGEEYCVQGPVVPEPKQSLESSSTTLVMSASTPTSTSRSTTAVEEAPTIIPGCESRMIF